ncbi:hypothetical protein OG225_04070 [Nocardia sp. NBC_01377]
MSADRTGVARLSAECWASTRPSCKVASTAGNPGDAEIGALRFVDVE